MKLNRMRFVRAPATTSSAVLRYDEMYAWVANIFRVANLDANSASIVADALMRTEARGITTHGLSRIATYLNKLQSNELNPRPQIDLKRSDTVITCDADNALGQVAGRAVVDAACEAAITRPIVACRLKNVGHLGALGVVILPVAERGLIGLLLQATPPIMGISGSNGPLIGNNPFAMAAPRPNGPPVVIDMACSIAARGNLLLAARTGKTIPRGWALDISGKETRNPVEALAGSILPFAGYKGLAIAMMVETLAAGLTGGVFLEPKTDNSTVSAQATNALLIVLNPTLFGDKDSYETHCRTWTTYIAKKSLGKQRIPGERAHTAEIAAKQNGIGLSAPIYKELKEIAERLNVPLAS